MENQDLSWRSNKFNYGYSNKVFEPPCNGCADRNAECHAHCEKYLAFERERFRLQDKVSEKYRQEDGGAAHAFSRRLRIYKIRKYKSSGRTPVRF